MINKNLYAVIDIGTNTTRLLVKSAQEELLREIEITRLGADLENTGKLGDKGIETTTNQVIDFVEKAKSLGCDKESIFIFATAASRNAANGDLFISEVAERTGCETKIISGELEGKYAFNGAVSGINTLNEPCAVFDIGGGSTEFALSEKSDVRQCGQVVSIPIGSVRITKRHLVSDPPLPEELTNAISDILEYLNDVELQIPEIRSFKKWIGVAATVTTVAAVEIGMKEFDPETIHGIVLTKSMVEDVFRTLATESLADRVHNPGLEEKRADVIVGGVAIIVSIMRHFELESIQVSCTDLLDGLWQSIAH